MRSFVRSLLATAVVAIPGVTTAAEVATTECRMIRDATERLACYDRANPVAVPQPDPRTEAVPQPETRTEAVSPAQAPAKPPAAAPAPAKAVPATPAPAAKTPEEPLVTESVEEAVETRAATRADTPPATVSSEADFGRSPEARTPPDEISEITATIADITRMWPTGRWRYTLDNGQQWAQTRAKNVWVEQGDTVTIRKRRVTYFMILEGGTSFGVERID